MPVTELESAMQTIANIFDQYKAELPNPSAYTKEELKKLKMEQLPNLIQKKKIPEVLDGRKELKKCSQMILEILKVAATETPKKLSNHIP